MSTACCLGFHNSSDYAEKPFRGFQTVGSACTSHEQDSSRCCRCAASIRPAARTRANTDQLGVPTGVLFNALLHGQYDA